MTQYLRYVVSLIFDELLGEESKLVRTHANLKKASFETVSLIQENERIEIRDDAIEEAREVLLVRIEELKIMQTEHTAGMEAIEHNLNQWNVVFGLRSSNTCVQRHLDDVAANGRQIERLRGQTIEVQLAETQRYGSILSQLANGLQRVNSLDTSSMTVKNDHAYVQLANDGTTHAYTAFLEGVVPAPQEIGGELTELLQDLEDDHEGLLGPSRAKCVRG